MACCSPAKRPELAEILDIEPEPSVPEPVELADDERLWQCKCGKAQIKLKGEPIMCFNCHCHSCVGPARQVDAKDNPGTSALTSGEAGGVANAIWYLSEVEPVNLDTIEVGFIKVGPTGSNIRTYTKCCNTLMMTAGGAGFPAGFRPFSRNCITNKDGTPFEPTAVPCNVNAANAFEPEKVLDPKADSMPMGDMMTMMGGVLSYQTFGCGVGRNNPIGLPWAFKAGVEDDVETVDITWEGSVDAPVA